jgi:hypothetical protein
MPDSTIGGERARIVLTDWQSMNDCVSEEQYPALAMLLGRGFAIGRTRLIGVTGPDMRPLEVFEGTVENRDIGMSLLIRGPSLVGVLRVLDAVAGGVAVLWDEGMFISVQQISVESRAEPW